MNLSNLSPTVLHVEDDPALVELVQTAMHPSWCFKKQELDFEELVG